MSDHGEELPEPKWAEFPERACREPVSPDGLIDHWCGLKEWHAGPHCPKTLREAIRRRQEWERDNPGWERMEGSTFSDPFADITRPEPQEVPDAAVQATGPDGDQAPPARRKRPSRASRAADQAR